MATSKDVAAKAGVSHTTVSRAFRGDVKLKPSTYERVMTAARELNYMPNSLASGLKKKQTKTVGFINSDIADPLSLLIAQKLEEMMNREGYRLIVSFDACDFYKQQRAVKTMLSLQTEVIIFKPIQGSGRCEFIDRSVAKFIQLFYPMYEGIPAIRFDNHYGAYLGASYLLQNGHRKIMIVGDSDRTQGCIDACAAYSEKPFLLCGHYDTEECLANVAAECICRNRPTAVFAVGGGHAKGVFAAFRKLGLFFPKDISFLVFDDLEWAKMMDISVIAHPIEELAKTVTEQVLSLSRHGGVPSDRIFKPFLIERGSVKNIADSV